MGQPDEDRVPGDHLTPEERDPEAPEVDAVEQAAELSETRDAPVSRGLEVGEFDAVEQARTVGFDDDYR